jgi:hypothetical protein
LNKNNGQPATMAIVHYCPEEMKNRIVFLISIALPSLMFG